VTQDNKETKTENTEVRSEKTAPNNENVPIDESLFVEEEIPDVD
jgi:hypothetical protein